MTARKGKIFKSPDPVFDTREGITQAIATLDGFHQLCGDRLDFVLTHHTTLHQWVLFNGRVLLDRDGRFGWAEKSNFVSGDVFSHEEFSSFYQMLSEAGRQGVKDTYVYGTRVPHDGMTCPICNKEWTTDNFLDSVSKCTHESFDLAGAIGMTLAEWESHNSDSHTQAILHLFRTDDKMSKMCPEDTVIDEGHSGILYLYSFSHPDCCQLWKSVNDQKKFSLAFKSAGFLHTIFSEIPNEHMRTNTSPMWFNVRTELGNIIIGSHELYTVEIRCDLIDMTKVAEDHVTCGENFIEATGIEMVQKILTTMHGKLMEKI